MFQENNDPQVVSFTGINDTQSGGWVPLGGVEPLMGAVRDWFSPSLDLYLSFFNTFLPHIL